MASTRRLAAILASDVAGYSRLMGADEEGTLTRLKALRADPPSCSIAKLPSATIGARLRYARLRHQAAVEDVDYRAARGLDRCGPSSAMTCSRSSKTATAAAPP